MQRSHGLWHAHLAEQRHDSARALRGRDRSFDRGLQLGGPRLRVAQLLAKLGDGFELCRRFVESLRCAVGVLLDHPLVERDCVLLLGGERRRPGPHPLVDTEVEQLDEEVLTIGGLVVKELRELPLREDHAAREVVERQADQLGNRGVHALRVPGQHFAVTLEPRLLRGRARLGSPHDPRRDVLRFAELEREAHACLVGSLRDRGCDEPIVVVARNDAVQREADRVEDARLARTGRSDEREEVGTGEVDGHCVTKRREALGGDRDRTHQLASSRSSANSAVSRPSETPTLSR